MSIEASVEGIEKVQKAFKNNPKRVNRVLSRAVNRTTVNVRANMAKKVREQYTVKSSAVKDSIVITRATADKPFAIVKSAGKKINLAKFRISPTERKSPKNPPRGGYKVQVKKSEGLKPVPRGFLLESSSGTLAFFQRLGAARLPIKRLMGPAIPQMINHAQTVEYIESEARKMLNNRIDSELAWALGGKKA